MSTRAAIGVQQEDGSIKAIYCHWDGYPDGAGLMLETFYGNPDDANKLIAMGHVSMIGATIGKKVEFGSYQGGGQCVFFGRDREESFQEAEIFLSLEDFKNALDSWGVQYAYFMETDHWVAYKVEYPVYDEGKSVKLLGRLRVKVEFDQVA
jgi:hypothetical protein